MPEVAKWTDVSFGRTLINALFRTVAGLMALFLIAACASRPSTQLDPVLQTESESQAEPSELVSVVEPIDTIARNHPGETELSLTSGLPFARIWTSAGVMDVIIDTGSDQFIVAKDFAQAAKLVFSPIREQISDIGGRELLLEQSVMLAGLRVGSERFENIRASVAPLNSIGRLLGRSVDGVLGLRLFADHLVKLDLAEGRLQVLSHDGRVLPGGYAYHSHRGRVVVDLEIGGHVIPALIDTGDNGHIGIHNALFDSLKRIETVRNINVRGFAGVTTAQESLIKDEIWLGPWQLPNGPVRFAAYPSPDTVAARIGTAMLSRFRITIDQRNQLIQLVPI